MPFYDYHCDKCNSGTSQMRFVAEREDSPKCIFCDQKMRLVISPVAGIVRNPAVPRRSKPYIPE
jgi:putative FmdB family regulatory protein